MSDRHGVRAEDVLSMTEGMGRGCEILSRAKETTPRRILLPSPKHKNLCTNIFRNTRLEPASSCAHMQKSHCRPGEGTMDSHVSNPKQTPKRGTLTHWGWGAPSWQTPVVPRSLFSAGPAQSTFYTAENPQGDVHCHRARVTRTCHTCHQPSQGISSLLPALSNVWAGCRAQTSCHDHQICHSKPGLYHTELLWLQVHDTSQCFQIWWEHKEIIQLLKKGWSQQR